MAGLWPPDVIRHSPTPPPQEPKSTETRKARSYTYHLAPGPRKILDVGCGRGRFLAILQRAGRPEWELHGIDLDAAAIDAAQGRGFKAAVATIGRHNPPERFDLIVLQQIIEHVADPKAELTKLYHLLAQPRSRLARS